jgi:ribose transport system permease protein
METTFVNQNSTLQRIWDAIRKVPFIYYILALVLLAILVIQPSFYRPGLLLSFLKRSAPIMIVAMGQAYVLIAGEIDLSVGSLVTVCAVAAAFIIDHDPDNVGLAILCMALISLAVGIINGVITTRLRVPAFVTTLGMLLILQGGISIVTRGAPKGGITDNFRFYGRDAVGGIPVALIFMIVLAIILIAIMSYTNFGRRVYAVGGNPLASRLAGVNVAGTKTLTFIICSMCGMVSALLVAGYSGVSTLTVGEGYEFSAISAAVLGGVAMTGGRGRIASVIVGALTLQALFSLLNFLSLPSPLRDTVQGIIIISAMAITVWRDRR